MKKFVQAVKNGKIYIKNPQLYDIFIASDTLRHTCFGNVRYPGYEEAVDNFITAWNAAGLGVGVKIHLIQHHLLQEMSKLRPGEGLGVWSEQALESDHSVFKFIAPRYIHFKDTLKKAIEDHNFKRM